MNRTTVLLNSRKAELEKYRIDALKRLEKLKYKGVPECRIRFSSKKNEIYLIGKDKKEQYISFKQRDYVRQVATFEYLNKVIKIIDAEIKQIETALKSQNAVSLEDYYETLNKTRQEMITPIRLTDEQLVESWMAQSYEEGEFEEGEAGFYTDKNERVRSKSEILIANALNRYNVPYKYECPIVLKGLGKIRPDFTALNIKRRKIYYWEHLGKLDDVDYARKNVLRINAYEKNGLFHGESLITTWETSTLPLDVKLVDRIIRHYLLE